MKKLLLSGAIAGAYIARAHFGALGMHHSGRWRRPRLLVLAWLVPIVLHAGFDAPLFSLKHASADTGEHAQRRDSEQVEPLTHSHGRARRGEHGNAGVVENYLQHACTVGAR